MSSIENLPTRIGVVTVSDRASRGEYEDKGGPAILQYLSRVVATNFDTVCRVIADETSLIQATLIELADEQLCHLIVTTGGTGPARRDVTPEATLAVSSREMPGFGELMRAVSLTKVPTAILSCQTAGVRHAADHSSLIINLPGNPKAIAECLNAVFPAIPYCLDLINPGGPRLETNPSYVKSFRPKR
jgi:molybdopterin adenylyltransferase